MSNGEIPVLLIDGKFLLLERDLEDFLEERYGTVRVAEKPKADRPSRRSSRSRNS